MTQHCLAWRRRGYAFLARLGVRPTGTVSHGALEVAIARFEQVGLPGGLVALGAGCGRKSPLVPFRHRIERLVGVDIHRPARLPRWPDEFAVVNLCGADDELAAEGFDLVLSNFTVEHFARPDRAFATLYRCLRPGGVIVLSTVNPRHPFVGTVG